MRTQPQAGPLNGSHSPARPCPVATPRASRCRQNSISNARGERRVWQAVKGVDRAVQQSHKPSPDLDVPLSHQAAIVASTPPSASVPPYPSLYALLDEYRSRSAPILKDCRALADLGLRSRLEPPTVVVGGDRGSGKSRIVSRLCGLDVPTAGPDGQPAMRCPLVIEMVTSAGSRGRVSSVRVSRDDRPTGAPDMPWYQVQVRRTSDAVTGQPLHHVLTTPFGPPVLDPRQLSQAILKAQAHLLNPSRPMSDFLDYLPVNADANELLVSANAVLVEVHNAPLDLTIIDLPGLTPHHEAYTADILPQQLEAARTLRKATLEFMSTPHAVLLAVVSCSTDVAHQEVLDLARRVDPSGRRTLGVLTHSGSPSATPHVAGARELVSGRVMPLRLGYVLLDEPAHAFCARGGAAGSPSGADTTEDESGVSTSGQGQGAAQNNPLALLMQEALQAGRLGEGSLGHLTSGLLLEQLALQLPAIHSQVSERLRHVRAQLELLNPSARPDELAQHARTQFKSMARSFDDAVRGQGTGQEAVRFVRDIMDIYRDFGRRIVSSRPRFQLAGPDAHQRIASGIVHPASPTHHNTDPHAAMTHGHNHPHDPHMMEPILARYGEEDEEGDPLYYPGVAVTTVDDVKRLLAAQRGLELPTSDLWDSAATRCIRHFQGMWRRDATTLLDAVTARLLEETHAVIAQYFSAHPRLAEQLRGYCVDLVFNVHQKAKIQLDMLVDMELSPDNPPLTLLDRHFHILQEVLVAGMQDVRARATRSHQPHMHVEERATKVEAVRQLLHELGTDTSTWTDQQLLERLSVAAAQEQDGSAIRVMAASMAFFKVSSRRFRDSVPLSIRHHMINAVAGAFDDHLERNLMALAATAGDAWPCAACAARGRSESPEPGSATATPATTNTNTNTSTSHPATLTNPTTATDNKSISTSKAHAQAQSQTQAQAQSGVDGTQIAGGNGGAGGGMQSGDKDNDLMTNMAHLGWASSPSVLCLMTGGPLDAYKEAERQQLTVAREALARLSARVAAHMRPHVF